MAEIPDENSIVTAIGDRTIYSISVAAPQLTPREYTESILSLYEEFTNCFEEIFVPTEVEIVPYYAPADLKGKAVLDQAERLNPGKTISIAGDPVCINQLSIAVDDLTAPTGHEVFVKEFKITDSRAKVFLEQGWVEVDTDSSIYYFRKRDQIRESRPSDPPWTVRIRYRTRSDSDDRTDGSEIKYRISLITPVNKYWDVYQNRIDRINGARLCRALESFKRTHDIISDYWTSGFVVVSWALVEEVLTGEVGGHPEIDLPDWPDTEAMIERYRSDWADEHVTDCDQIEDGDEVVLACTCEESIPEAELRARVEAFVRRRSEEGSPVVDRVRIDRPERPPLEATVSESGLEWVDD